MLLRLRRWQPHREIIAVADGGYASPKLLDRCRSLRRPITFITRLRLDAALYEPAPPRYPGQIGRPRLKGERLPNLSAVLEDPKTAWTPIRVSGWYGGGERSVEVVSETAVWYSTGLPAVVLRWVLIRDPRRVREPGFAMHRPLSRSGSDHRAVCETLADGVHVSRSSPASGIRDGKASVGDGREAHGSGAFGPILRGDALRSPREGTNAGVGAEDGLVREGASDLLRCFGVGQKGVAGTTRGDFLRVGAGKRPGKSPAGVHGKANRRGLLCSLMAKVHLRA
jgi:hypothetical protein